MSVFTIKDKLKDAESRDLLRVLFSHKEYAVFNYHVFNVGARIDVICTDDYSRYETYLEDGYSYVIPFYDGEKGYIYDILMDRLKEISAAWTKNCYYYTFAEHLKEYKLSMYNYKRLLKLEKGGNYEY